MYYTKIVANQIRASMAFQVAVPNQLQNIEIGRQSIHKPGVLYEAYKPQQARPHWNRLNWCTHPGTALVECSGGGNYCIELTDISVPGAQPMNRSLGAV